MVVEVREECGYCVKTEDLGCKHYFMMGMEYKKSLLGLIELEFKGDPMLLEVHVFQTRTFSGEMTETEEMRPQWWEEAEVRVTTAVLS